MECLCQVLGLLLWVGVCRFASVCEVFTTDADGSRYVPFACHEAKLVRDLVHDAEEVGGCEEGRCRCFAEVFCPCRPTFHLDRICFMKNMEVSLRARVQSAVRDGDILHEIVDSFGEICGQSV